MLENIDVPVMKCAIVTMSYKDDFEECRLLCESIDRYVPRDICHYIFVRDGDLKLFKCLEEGGENRRFIIPKSSVLPWWSIDLPFRFMKHYFRISPFTMPVRGWIIQQIVKLSVWSVIDARVDVYLNVDSECVFMKPFDPSVVLNGGELGIYREKMNWESNEDIIRAHEQFCSSAKRLLGLEKPVKEIGEYYYIAPVVAFRRDTLMDLCNEIGKRHWSRNYKIALMNTYRFSEYFLYSNYVYHKLGLKGHFELKDNYFSMLKYSFFDRTEELKEKIGQTVAKSGVQGIWFQKNGTRHRHEKGAIAFSQLREIIYEMWTKQDRLANDDGKHAL